MTSRNWPMWWRIIALLNISFYNMMNNFFAAGIPPLFGLIIKEFHCTSAQASRLSSYALLMLGLANVYSLVAVYFLGKRVTILVTLATLMGANIWAATASSLSSLRATRFLGGISGGVIEGLGPWIIADLFPRHQLGRAMVVYVFFISVGSSLGPMFAGIIALHLADWRSFFKVSAILLGANLVSSILMLPETGATAEVDQSMNVQDENMIETAVSTKHNQAAHLEHIVQEVRMSTNKPCLRDLWIKRSFRPCKLADHHERWYTLWLEPFRLLLTPEVLTTVLLWSANVGWILVASIISSLRYQSAPHRWNSQQVGLLNLGPFVGLLLGIPFGGPAADRLIFRASQDGLRADPKVRLPLLIPGSIISPVGCLFMGLSLENNWHWMVFATGYGMLGFGITSSCSILLTYSVDLFESAAAHVGIIVHLVKYLLSFGMTYGAVDWFTSMGPASQFGTMAGVLGAINVLPIFLYVFSHQIHQYSVRVVRLQR